MVNDPVAGPVADPVAVSVITVTHARRELLLEKAGTLADQELPATEFEWVVVVNGDTDGSARALEAWSAKHPDIAVATLREEPAADVGMARNRAAGEARGEILYFSDDDCLLAPDTLARHLAAQRRAPGTWLGPVDFRTYDADERWTPAPRWWQVNGANTSVPAADFERIGGFEDIVDGYGGEDLLLGWRLHRAGVRFGVVAGGEVVHSGPNPVRGGDLAKARRAGANAARIAEHCPGTALRLGVHPWSLAIKRALYGAPWSAWLARRAGGWFRYERAYFYGAIERRKARHA